MPSRLLARARIRVWRVRLKEAVGFIFAIGMVLLGDGEFGGSPLFWLPGPPGFPWKQGGRRLTFVPMSLRKKPVLV